MTFQDLISQVLVRVHETIPSTRLDIGTTAQMVNAAIQDTYIKAVAADPDYYTKSVSVSGTTFSLPTDFFKARFLFVPGATYKRARIVDMRTAEFLNASSVQQGISTDPVAVISGATMEMTPSITGTLYYLWKIPVITDYATEITEFNGSTLAYIPQVYEEDIALNAQRQITLRLAGDGTDALSLGADQIQALTQSLESLEASYTPDTIYGMSVNRPVVVPDPRQMVPGQL